MPMKLSSLRRVVTQEEQAEEKRRWKAIRSGRHPDTGQRLRSRDDKTLKPEERFWLRTQQEARMYRAGLEYTYWNPSLVDDALARQSAMGFSYDLEAAWRRQCYL